MVTCLITSARLWSPASVTLFVCLQYYANTATAAVVVKLSEHIGNGFVDRANKFARWQHGTRFDVPGNTRLAIKVIFLKLQPQKNEI